jgi:hypothetical protein
MKGLKALAATMLACVLLVAAMATPAGAAGGAAAYKHYIGCGLSRNAKPAHACPKGAKKGAFFRSNNANVRYTVCVRFPNKKLKCTETPQEADQGTLYVNRITSTVPGKHVVSWFVKGKKVGSTAFRVKG